MSLTFKRMYVDIPAETHDKLKILAVEKGMSQKGLVADLIEAACIPETQTSRPNPPTRKRKVTRKKPAKSKRKTRKKRSS